MKRLQREAVRRLTRLCRRGCERSWDGGGRIAASSGLEGDGRYKGVAWESDLLIVKLGVPATDSFPRTTEMMRALDYVMNRAVFTETAGCQSQLRYIWLYDGTSLLETYLNTMAAQGKKPTVVAGTGNEGITMGHTSVCSDGREAREIELCRWMATKPASAYSCGRFMRIFLMSYWWDPEALR